MLASLNFVGCAFALMAAAFWLSSAAVRFPELRPDADTIVNDLQLRSRALRRQSRRNAAAAMAATGAAILQAIGLIAAWLN
jgi:hypothetical protein